MTTRTTWTNPLTIFVKEKGAGERLVAYLLVGALLGALAGALLGWITAPKTYTGKQTFERVLKAGAGGAVALAVLGGILVAWQEMKLHAADHEAMLNAVQDPGCKQLQAQNVSLTAELKDADQKIGQWSDAYNEQKAEILRLQSSQGRTVTVVQGAPSLPPRSAV